jgi:hypothetical protein
MRQDASKCDDLRKRHLSLNCFNQGLCELFGEKLILLPKLDFVGLRCIPAADMTPFSGLSKGI